MMEEVENQEPETIKSRTDLNFSNQLLQSVFIANKDLLDTDEDGLSDFEERRIGTDPTLADVEHYGLEDSQKLVTETDPLSVDTDADGVSDAQEIAKGSNSSSGVDVAKTKEIMQTAKSFLKNMGVKNWDPADGNYAIERKGDGHLQITSKSDNRGNILLLEDGTLSTNSLNSRDVAFFEKVARSMNQHLQQAKQETQQKQAEIHLD